jgi:hypothetical protein
MDAKRFKNRCKSDKNKGEKSACGVKISMMWEGLEDRWPGSDR